MGHGRGLVDGGHGHHARDDIRRNLRNGLVGPVHDLHARDALEPLHHQMAARAHAPGCVRQILARLGILDELLEVFHRDLRVHDQQVATTPAHACDRRERIERIHRRLEHDQLVGHGGCGEGHQQGVTIGHGARHFLRGQHAGGARLVVDDNLGAQFLGQPFGALAREDVCATAGAAGDHDADGLAGLRPDRLGRHAPCGRTQCCSRGGLQQRTP